MEKEMEKTIKELSQNAKEACQVILDLLEPMFTESPFDTADIFAGLVFTTTAVGAQITVPDENGRKRKHIKSVLNTLISAALNDLDVK